MKPMLCSLKEGNATPHKNILVGCMSDKKHSIILLILVTLHFRLAYPALGKQDCSQQKFYLLQLQRCLAPFPL